MRHANFIFVISLFLGLLLSDLGEPVYGDIYEKVWDSGDSIFNNPYDVEVGDTDGDGMGEIIVADYPDSQYGSAEIYIFENTGNDSYQLVWRSGSLLTMRICLIEIGDQDLDGKSEIIAVESRTQPSYSGQLHVFENTGDNSYAEVWNNGSEFSGIESISLFLGDDLDNDGKPEIVVGTGWQCGDHKIRVYENTGDNAYQEVWNSGATIEDTVCEGATGDTDGDGNKEIIVGSGNYTNKALVFENVGDNSYELVWSSSPAFSLAVVANIGDQDADEKAEIIVSDRTGWKVHVYENIGDNEYADVWNTGIMSNYVYLTATGDQDLDGKREIIVPCKDGRVYVFENTGDNSYQEVWNSGDVMGGPIYRVVTGDQDNDGKPEMIAISLSDRKVYVFEINRPPSVDANGPYSVAEGSSINVTATGSDPDGDPLTYAWDLDNDGIFETPGQSATFSAAGLDGPTSCVIAVQATDPGGLSVADQASVTVSNVPPTVDAGPDATINEGGTFASSGLFTDPGADTWSATVDYGDGTGEQPLALNPDKTFSLSQAYSDDGAYTVTVTVDDGDGGVGVDTVIVIVNDLAPTASFTWSPEPQDEGAPVQFTDTSTSSPDAIASWSWDFGDTNTSAEQNPSHAYSDNGAYTVTLIVTDDDGSTDSVSHTVTISNVAPTADAGVDQTVDEGDTVSFSGSFSDPGTGDTHTIDWDFGDGDTAPGTLMPTHAYADNGVHIVTLTVTDDDGGVGTDTLTVTVNNVAPTADAGVDQTVDEGDTVSFSGSFSDPGTGDTHTIDWDFGDGDTAPGTLTPTHAYADNGVYIVTLTVTDDDGGVGTDTLTVTVNNVAPIVDAGADQIANEGDTVSFSGSFSDPGSADSHNIEWTFGDGDTASGTLTPTHAYADNGVYTVTLTVTDDDGGVGTDTLTVTVNNVAPTADAGVDQTVDEGYTVSFSGSFSDPGSADSHTIEWTFGDNGTASGTLIPDHTYVDDGIYTVTLTVTDGDGGVGTDTLTVTVENLPPIVDAGSDAATDEGTEIAFSGSFVDPGVLDTHTVAWDFGDSGSATGTLTPSHAYGDNGVYTVRLTVTDDDGGVGVDTLAVTVNNVPPDVGQINASLDPIEVNTEVNASADFSDPGWLDNHTAVWDWGDGTEDTLPDVTGSVTGSHTYDTPGVYTVTLTVTDDDSGSDFSTFEYIVIYDPSGGFVTGGGWIMSPEGAYAADPTLTGKANFGFVSKYKEGADLPTGETEFNFKVADLNFHSESYQWLVVSGPKAKYKGVGTINGDGNYGFMLTAIDEKLTPSTDVDLFRMKIWDKDADDATVYDNQMGDGDDADPTTAIGGGSIVIHKEDGDDPPMAPSLLSLLPKLKCLLAAYPNPGNPEIWLPYQLDSACQVVIRIYDMSGRLVRALNLGEKQAGHYISKEQAAYWDGRNEAGEPVTSGIYFYSIQAGEFTATKKMVIAK